VIPILEAQYSSFPFHVLSPRACPLSRSLLRKRRFYSLEEFHSFCETSMLLLAIIALFVQFSLGSQHLCECLIQALGLGRKLTLREDPRFTNGTTPSTTVAPSSSRPLSSSASLTSPASLTGPCVPDCSARQGSTHYMWIKQPVTTEIPAVKVIVIFNKATNKTRTTTEYLDLPAGFTIPPTNAAGFQVQTLSIETAFGQQPKAYTLSVLIYLSPHISPF
jgi:hypothetical protein